MNASTLQGRLFRWLRQASVPAASPQADWVRLRPNQPLTIFKSSGRRRIELRHGVVWLTETPAESDVVLTAGERFSFTNRYPVVVEALDEAEIRFSA